MNTENITKVLNSTIESLGSVVPMEQNVGKPSLIKSPVQQEEVGILIGVLGDLKGRIIILGNEGDFSSIGETMFGMPLEGEMLHSFSGELGNMISGNMCTIATQKGLNLDITPPTVSIGKTQFYGINKALKMEVTLGQKSNLTLILGLEE